MQLLDIPHRLSISDHISGANRIYLAPELLDEEAIITGKADIYSMGAILYLLITKGVSENYNQAVSSPTKHKTRGSVQPSDFFTFKESEWINISKNLQDFVRSCLEKNVIRRA